MIGAILIMALGGYCIITIFLLMLISEFSFINSKHGALKFFGWPIYFPLKAIKEICIFLYCGVFIKALDKLFEKK